MPKYSKATGWFYDAKVHGDAIPSDAIDISAADHAALLEGQRAGKIIAPDATGYPVLTDPAKPKPSQIWKSIKAERDRRTNRGGFKVGDKWFHSDQKSRGQQRDLVLRGAGLPADLQWKTMDGSFVTMTQQLASDVLAAATVSDRAIFAAAEAHRAAMEASADPASYDFSSGWPETFTDAG